MLAFSVVFVTLGLALSAVGALLVDIRQWIARLGGAVVAIFGLHTMGVIHIPLLDVDIRLQRRPRAGSGLLSSSLMGVFFSAGWAPCVGPVLGAVLTLALNGGDPAQGAALLSAYSAGLAIPFLLTALGIGRLASSMRRHARLIRWTSKITGAVLVLVGVLLISGALQTLARFGFFVDFGL